MAHTLPFHSSEKAAHPLYHTNDACRLGHLIEPRLRQPGEGGCEPCAACIRLDAEEYASTN